MASVKKFGFPAVVNQLRHVERTIQDNANKDIDPDKISLDYSLIDRGISSYSYFKQRLNDLYIYKNRELKPLCGWIITLPEDVPAGKEDLFFKMSFDFLNQRYGLENCVQCTVHKDESGQPHMHYLFIPVAKRKKTTEKHPEQYKVCANEVLTKRDLRDFHPALDKYLRDRNLPCSVYTGVTAKQGGNRTVTQLKAERDTQRQRQVERPSLTW